MELSLPRARRTNRPGRTVAAGIGWWRAMLVLLAGTLCAAPATALASGVTYMYKEEDGTVWLTDRPASGAQLRQFEFIGYHGRPPATASCRGVDSDLLDRRAESINDPLTQFAAQFDVEPALARAIIAVESCFDPDAVSRVGAEGLMQLMPRTAESLGVQNSFDIHENLRGGLQYFSLMRERYGGDTVRALAAYNAGPNAVDRHGGIPPFPETQNYVQRVLDRWGEYRDALLQ